MKLFEVAIKYHDKLNPKIWDGKKLKPKVREKLKEIANEFFNFLGIPTLNVEDVILTGSIANYNWHDLSDIDLHLIINLEDVQNSCPEFTDDFFTDKKSLWNEHHQIEIYSHPVELYVQEAKEKHITTGMFSIEKNKWLCEPEYNPPDYNNEDVRIKANQYKKEIDRLIKSQGSNDAVKQMKEKLRNYRRAGLDKYGEFSTENLVFKELRHTRYLEKLQKYGREAYSDELSLP